MVFGKLDITHLISAPLKVKPNFLFFLFLSFYEEWIKGKFDNRTFKAQIVNSDEINNTGSIFENIVIERLSDGSYMDYGERYVANLGIYKCSCDYVYSIGNCGYAMVTRPCPKCGKQISRS